MSKSFGKAVLCCLVHALTVISLPAAANTQGLVDGGLSGLFWSYIWTFVGFGLIIASMVRVAIISSIC